MKNNFSHYVPHPATLVARKDLSDMVTLYEFAPDNGRPLAHRPGQFVELSIYGVGEAPFSISSAPERDNHHFEIAVRKIGSVTSALSRLQAGDKIGVRGPYGSFFPIQHFVGHDVLFVAGGLGLIPLRSLLNYMLRHRDEFGRIIVLVGTRNPSERIFTDQLEKLEARKDVEVHETVDYPDDTWAGNVGVITTLLPKIDLKASQTYVAMIGPPVMYKFVLMECQKLGIQPGQIYVSLERHMKCGVGKCGHCQINGINCCIEGPVFSYTDIQGLGEAI